MGSIEKMETCDKYGQLEWSQNQQSCDQGLGIFGMHTIIVLPSQILSSQPK